MKRAFCFWMLIALLLITSGCGREEAFLNTATYKQGYEKAVLFSLPKLDGNLVSLEDLVGKKIILLDFSTIRCPYCSKIIPDLNALNKDYTTKLEIIAIYLGERSSALKSYVEKHGIKYTVLTDTSAQTAQQYGIVGVPTLFVIDLEGKIIYSGHNVKGAEKTIEQLIIE